MVSKANPKAGFAISALAYLASSYLLLIRDNFTLVKLSLASNFSFIQTIGNRTTLWLDQVLLHPNSLSLIFFSLSVAGLYYFYLKLLAHSNSKSNLITKKFYFLVWTIFILSFPSLSTDIFDYNATNRVALVYEQNPWTTPALTFQDSDPAISLASWNFRASVYPLITFAISSLVHFIFGQNILLVIAGFKLTAALFFLVILKLLTKWPQKIPLSKLNHFSLVALNPMMLIEFLGNGHNDLIMVAALVGSLFLLAKSRPSLAGFIFALGILSKITIAVYFPVLIVWFVIHKNFTKIKDFFTSTLTATIAGFAVLGDSAFQLFENLQSQTQIYLQSFPTVVQRSLLAKLGSDEVDRANQLERLFTTPIFGIVILKIIHSLKTLGLYDVMILAMMAFLYIFTSLLQPWYIVWFFPLTVLASNHKLKLACLLATFGALSRYMIYFTSLYFLPHHFAWQPITYALMVIPVLLAFLAPPKWYTRSKLSKLLPVTS